MVGHVGASALVDTANSDKGADVVNLSLGDTCGEGILARSSFGRFPSKPFGGKAPGSEADDSPGGIFSVMATSRRRSPQLLEKAGVLRTGYFSRKSSHVGGRTKPA